MITKDRTAVIPRKNGEDYEGEAFVGMEIGMLECLRHADEDKSAGITHTVATGVGFIGRNSC